ncbi:DNA-directed RNA polymerase, partial [Dipsacomyces acuminosporus]
LRPDLGPGAMRRRRLNNLATKPMTTVVWTTPLGLTVVQPYRKYVMRTVTTSLQNISIQDSNMPSPVNSQKQKTAFPPNFVHSLDASHMILSAIECKKENLVFASVHDSYWTHACDIDAMNQILRDQFVKLHQRPIMDDLKAEFEERYKNHKMPVVRWEYANKDAFYDGGKVKAKRGRKPKQAVREEQERLVEKELARHHLEFCGEEESSTIDKLTHQGDLEADHEPEHAAQPNGPVENTLMNDPEPEPEPKPTADKAPAFTAPLEVIDLDSVRLIDPRKDLAGAARQADLIAYTLSVNRKKLDGEISKVRAEYKKNAKKLQTLSKSSTKAAAKAKAQADTEAETEAEAEQEASAPPQPADKATQALKALKEEMAATIAELERKYEELTPLPKVMASPVESPEQFAKAEEMIKDGQLAGRLVKRIEWVDIEFDPLPAHGDFKIEEVMNSPYFFS